jgi:hypothetical protein
MNGFRVARAPFVQYFYRSMPNLSLRTYQWGLLFVLWICAVVIAIRYEVDFTVMYRVSRLVLSDVSQVYGTSHGPGFYYGPVTFVFTAPLALLSFPAAKFVWIVLQTIAFSVFWIFLHKKFEVIRRNQWAWIWVFAVSINPVHLNFQSNNIQLMLLAILMVAQTLSNRPESAWQFLSGVLVAGTGAVKLYPLFMVVYFALVKTNQVRLGLLAGFLLAIGIPFAQFGIGDALTLYEGFLSSLGRYHSENSLIESFNIQCLPSVLARVLPLEISTGKAFAPLVIACIGLVSAIFYFLVFQKREVARRDERYEKYLWSFGLALMVFLNPSSFGHYLVFFVPAVASLVEICEKRESRNWIATGGLIVGSVLMALVVDGIIGKPLSHALQRLCVPSIGLTAICLALYAELSRWQSALAYRPAQ